jgi:DNA primase
MSLIDLALQAGLQPRRTASTHGGEYHSPCPACNGNDRFTIWPISGRYWCRRCEVSGDAIQFCRNFLGLTFQEACLKLNVEPRGCISRTLAVPPEFDFKTATEPTEQWQEKAMTFTHWAHQQLLLNQNILSLLFERGFTEQSIMKYKLGYCKNTKVQTINDIFSLRQSWGLPLALKPDGNEKKLWLPHGIVIPIFRDEKIIKLKIRRQDWQLGDQHKYVVISGSTSSPAIFGDMLLQPPLLVEAEFDAMLIQQEASDVCSCIALGGLGKPDLATHRLLMKCPIVLFALDFDDAGKDAYNFWRHTYPQLRPWPISETKSPGDAFQAGVNLKQWVLDGLKHYLR